ncbi:site-specific integrase [Methylotenera sp.]|uniref:site-specific integrase n=1 Tax=Methylotenera sp. TaxID=2051956 RepID=UPI002ED78FFD
MDRKQLVKVRGKSLYLDFYYQGIRQRPSLGLEDTKANRLHAERLHSAIEHEISIGTFDFAKHFPNSKKAIDLNKSSNKTITLALDEYMRSAQRQLEKSTIKGYNSAIEFYLKPNFGHIKLTDLTASDVKAWIYSLSISAKRINNVLIPLRRVFEDAYAEEIIDKNPMLRVKNLPVKTEEPHPLTPAESEAILKELPQQGKNLIQFALWSGLRTSELIALEWSDVDFKAGVVRVRRAIVNKNAKQPKTKSGERDVKLFPPSLDALLDQKQFTYSSGSRVFNNPNTNKPWETDAQIRRTLWIPALMKAGIEYRTPYQTRHTYASTLLSAGEPPMWVANQMGHKDWAMIRRVYGRWIPEVDTTAGSKIMKIWSQNGHKELVNA